MENSLSMVNWILPNSGSDMLLQYALDGFNQGIWDVQHSAEPTGDPAFLTRIDYGNPKHVERGFRFMELFRDTFTGINPRGHRHFKSILIGAEGISEKEPFSCDTHYHVRAAKPGLWAMWYSGLPEAVDLFTGWADAWYEDAMRTDRGKPKCVMPSAAAYAGDTSHDSIIRNAGGAYGRLLSAL